MAALGESLRALEKKCREFADDAGAGPCNWRWFANRLAEILSDRQEVAPVAWPSERVSIADPHEPGYRIVGFKISESHPWHGKYGLSEPLNALDSAIAASTGQASGVWMAADPAKPGTYETVTLEIPTGKTSDARDALLKDLKWRMGDIREMLMSRGIGDQRIYGCDEWSTPTVNLAKAIELIDAAMEASR